MTSLSQPLARPPFSSDAVSAGSPVPLYYQLQLALRELVLTGKIPSGSLLPTEAQLQATYGVSRSTVRKAIDELVQAGLIVKRHGIGTFVADPEPGGYACLTSFTVEAMRQGRVPGTRVLRFEVVLDKEPGSSQLKLEKAEPVVFIKRLRLLDGEPIFVASSFVPRRLVPDLDAEALVSEGIDQSLYYLIQTHYGITLAEGEEVTSAVEADEDVARVFGLEPNSPVLKKTCLLRSKVGAPVIYEEAVWGAEQTNRVKWQPAVHAGGSTTRGETA